METGMPGDPRPTPLGTAEVHTSFTGAGSGTTASSSTFEDRSKTNRAKDKAGELKDRAGELTSQAQSKASEVLGRAQDALEEHGVLNTVRDNPLPALGLAFGLGFLLAGSDDDSSGKRGGSMSKAKNQLKGAVMGGLSAAVAQEARGLLGMAQGQGTQKQGGMLSSMLKNLTGQSSGQQSSGSAASSGATPHRPPSHQEMR